jgi:Mg/Co/Ni transporter MgtE
MDKLANIDYAVDKQMAKWDAICKKSGVEYIDYELIRVYRRYVDLDVLNENKHKKAKKAIKELKMIDLAKIMYGCIEDFEQKLLSAIDSEQGQKLLSKVTRSIYDNIQLKLSNLLEES